MFCSKCGKKMAEGSRFCTKCGTAVAAGGQGDSSGMGKSKGLFIGIAIVAIVVAITAIAAAAMLHAPSPEHDSSGEADNLPTLDLNEPADYRRVNEFLSAFAKVWGKEASCSSETMTCAERVDFIVHYCEVDEQDVVESKEGYGLYEVPGEGMGALEGYRLRIDADIVSNYMEEFFGVRDDFGEISGPALHENQYHEGFVYFGALQLGLPTGLALAKSATPLEDGLYRIDFDVYGINLATYRALSQDCYSYSPEQMMEAIGAKAPSSAGSAVVKMGTDGSLTLVSYDSSVAQLMKELEQEEWAKRTPASEPTKIETAYYTITTPATYGDVTYEVEEDFTNVYGRDGFGCLTTVHIGSASFMVACITDGFGWQGNYEVRNLGGIPALPGYHLSIATPKMESEDPASFRLLLVDKIDELAAGVQLNDAASVPAAPVFRINSGDEACAYIIERLQATGGRVPPIVEYAGETERGFRVHGYTQVKQGDYEYPVTQFWYDVSIDGSIYDTIFERDIDPETMT